MQKLELEKQRNLNVERNLNERNILNACTFKPKTNIKKKLPRNGSAKSGKETKSDHYITNTSPVKFDPKENQLEEPDYS